MRLRAFIVDDSKLARIAAGNAPKSDRRGIQAQAIAFAVFDMLGRNGTAAVNELPTIKAEVRVVLVPANGQSETGRKPRLRDSSQNSSKLSRPWRSSWGRRAL